MIYSQKKSMESSAELLIILQYLVEYLFGSFSWSIEDQVGRPNFGQYLLTFLCNFSRINSSILYKSATHGFSHFENDTFSKKKLKNLVFLCQNTQKIEEFILFKKTLPEATSFLHNFSTIAMSFIQTFSENKLFSEKINELFLEHFVYFEKNEEEINNKSNQILLKDLFLNSFAEFLKQIWNLTQTKKDENPSSIQLMKKLRYNILNNFAVELFISLKSLKIFNLCNNSKYEVNLHSSLLLQIINEKITRTPVNQILKSTTKQMIKNCLEHSYNLLENFEKKDERKTEFYDNIFFQRFIIFLNKASLKMPTLVRNTIENSSNGINGLVQCSLNWPDDVAKLSAIFFISKLAKRQYSDIVLNINEFFKVILQLIFKFIHKNNASNPSVLKKDINKSTKRVKESNKKNLPSFLATLDKKWQLSSDELKSTGLLKEEAVRLSINILSNFFAGFGDLSEPFISPSVSLVSLLFETYIKSKPVQERSTIRQRLEKSVENFIDQICVNIDFRICLKHSLNLIASSQEFFSVEVFSNTSQIVNRIIQGMNSELFAEKKEVLNQTLLNGLDNLCVLLVDTQSLTASSMTSLEDHLQYFEKGLKEKLNHAEVSSNEIKFKNLWIEAYLGFALKCNENELKTFFIEIKNWSLSEANSKSGESELFKKILENKKRQIIVEILNKLIKKISFMGLSLYEEVLQFYVEYQSEIVGLSRLTNKPGTEIPNEVDKHIIQNIRKKSNASSENDEILEEDLSDLEDDPKLTENVSLGKRRGSDISPSNQKNYYEWRLYLIESVQLEIFILESLKLLFENDEGSFMDAFKFENLSSQLIKIVSHFRLPGHRDRNVFFFETFVFPVISSLLKLVRGIQFFYKYKLLV